MFEELNKIVLSGKEYPFKCDILVLEKIQNKYGNLNEFENALVPHLKTKEKDVFPSAETVLDTLEWLINEGEAITAELEDRQPLTYTREQLARKNDMSLFRLANTLYTEFTNCFISKNVMTTQNQKEMAE